MKKFSAGNKSLFTENPDRTYEADPNIVQTLSLDEIEPCKYQARTLFNDESIRELAESIRKEGLLQPITVRRIEPRRYEIISGERRYRAHKLLNKSHIRAVELDKSDKQAATLSLIENIQREDLSPIEEAVGYKKLMDSFSLPIGKIAEVTGKSRPHINNLLRVLILPDEIKTAVHQGNISLGHAKVLLSAPEHSRMDLYNEVVNNDFTVRELEDIIKKQQKKERINNYSFRTKSIDDASVDALTEIFNRELNITLRVSNKSPGSLKCSFTVSKDELMRLIQKFSIFECGLNE